MATVDVDIKQLLEAGGQFGHKTERWHAMNVLYGGIKDLNGRPGAVVVFDIINDANAVREARKLNLPVVALVDTNADPSLVTYPIPSNDDAIKTLQLMADYFQKAVEVGK